MATTAEGQALTQQHRQRQLAVRAALIKQVLNIWPLFDIKDIDMSWKRIEPVLVQIMEHGRIASTLLATLYYEAFRLAEKIPGGLPEASNLAEDWQTAALVSLRITGPVAAKKAILLGRQDAAEQAFNSVSGSLSRHALDGGRSRIERLIHADGEALGYARVASGRACAFCAMLASRGPVYHVSSFQSHDHCSCTMEPVYSRGQQWPNNSREYRTLWDSSTSGTRGHESVLAFRRALEK